MTSSFSHVALLVRSVEAAAKLLNSKGIETGEPESFESEGTKEIYVGSYERQQGLLLLLEATSEGPYHRAMMKRGPSLHHVALDVLDIDAFITTAGSAGWKLHPVSERTMTHQTAWLYLEGVPTLIEVHQKNILSSKANKVSKLELPIRNDQLKLFEAIGLGDVVICGEELSLTVDAHTFAISQIASRE